MHIMLLQLGMPTYLADRVHALAAREGIKITVVTTASGQRGRPDESFENKNVAWHALAGDVAEDIPSKKMISKVLQKLGEVKPDLLYTGGTHPIYITAALTFARLKKIPTMTFSASTDYEPTRSSFLRRIFKRYVLKRIDAMLAPGMRARQHLLRFGVREDKIVDVGNPIDNQLFRTQAQALDKETLSQSLEALGLPKTPYLLFVGRFTAVKNLPRLLRAYAQARVDKPLVMVGDGEQKEELQALAKELGIENKVLFLGFFTRQELVAAYVGAKALLLPSLSETWGLVVNEALACGTPALVSDRVGCGPDLIQEGVSGWVVDPENIDSMAYGLRSAAHHHTTPYEKLWEIVTQHTIERFVDAFLDGCKLALKHAPKA